MTETRDASKILEATLGIEQSSLSLLEIIKGDNLKTVLKDYQVQEVQERFIQPQTKDDAHYHLL